MGLFIKKSVKSALDKSKLATSYAITALCAILIAANVGAFLYFPKIAAPLAIVLSNVITVLLMLVAVRPISSLIEKSFSDKAKALAEKEKEEQELREKVTALENRNRELESRIDTWTQTSNVPTNVNFTFKVETMTFDKTGYIVKEEPLEKFMADPVYKLSDKRGVFDRLSKWMDDITHPGNKRVLYIGKYYIKASIGIDFTKIKFSVDGGGLILSGVRFTKLNDLAIEADPDEVSHCWLINDEQGYITINQNDIYREFTEIYSRIRAEEADKALEDEVEALCEHYTAVFRSNLVERFPGIGFCDNIEDSTATWYSLKEHIHDERIYQVASNMFLMADVLSGYSDIPERKLLPE
jgi:predicted transcriptional regulator